MTSPRAYLDYNATAPLRPRAREAMLAALDRLGNPSSIHAEGRAARGLLETARGKIAAGLGTAARNLVFTSGATEAANLALTPHLRAGRDSAPFDLLLLSAGEHPCVLKGHRFPAEAALTLPLTADGQLSLAALEAALRAHAGRRIVLALQAANNETGVIQPVAEAARLVHAAGGLLVCDATQAVGRCNATFSTLGADVLLFSSHKLGGPVGAGALAFAREGLHIDDTILRGGGQEGGRRAGTENIAAAVGFASAFETATGESDEFEPARRASGRRRAADRGDTARGPVSRDERAAPAQHQRLLRAGDRRAYLGDGAGSGGRRGVLGLGLLLRQAARLACREAMGLNEAAMLRISLGWRSSAEDVELFGIALARVVDRIRSRSSAA